VTIREATDDDLDVVLDIERRAFGHDTEADLVKDLLADASAAPRLSLLAVEGGKPVGHVLFTSVKVVGTERAVRASILAPLAVTPEAQGRGCGRKLVEGGLLRLARSRVEMAFVLGDPHYYARFGFAPAGRLGLQAPYPIPEEHADAWMVKALGDGVVGSIAGRVRCADVLNRPELWRE
jgi:putative acetyltransferase